MKSTFSLVAALAVVSILPLQAATNLVTNGSFEDAPNGSFTPTGNWDYVSAGTGPGYTTGANTTLVTGWTATAIPQGGKYGLVNKNVFSPSLSTTGDGEALFIQDYNSNGSGYGSLTSDSLGTILPNSIYTLSLNIGAPSSLSGLSSSTAGKTAPQVYFALLGNGTAITSQTLLDTSVTQNGLTNYTLTFTTGATGGFVGDALTVQLKATKEYFNGVDPGGEAAIFDDVVVTVPEPSTYALMLGSCGLLALAMRRRMARD